MSDLVSRLRMYANESCGGRVESDLTGAADRIEQLERELAEVKESARELNASRNKLRRMLAEAQRDAERLTWLSELFVGQWDGTIGRPRTYQLRGDYRHLVSKLSGDTLAEAIDKARNSK